MKLEKIMLDDLIFINHKDYGVLEDKVELDAFLKVNKDKIVADYNKAEEDGVSMYNSVEVRTQILKDNLITDEDLEDFEVLYQDVNLEAIGETLKEITVEDLNRQLSHYGTWQIHLQNGLYILADFS